MSNGNPSAKLFAKQRDYRFICDIERGFFAGLAKKAGQFRGREISGDGSLTVAAALDTASPFILSKDDVALNVIVSFDISDGHKRANLDRMYLGTQLVPAKEPKNRQVTHFIALTKGDSCEVKLHLDLDFDVSSPEPKPSPHIQIGGRELCTKQAFSARWNPALDKPRLPCLPFCTPLLWHSAFMEFQECASVRPFVKEGWWTNLVKNAETAIWEPFIADMASGLRNGSVIEALYP